MKTLFSRVMNWLKKEWFLLLVIGVIGSIIVLFELF